MTCEEAGQTFMVIVATGLLTYADEHERKTLRCGLDKDTFASTCVRLVSIHG